MAIIFTDPLNNTVYLPSPPKRIVSLVPSLTELLFDLDLHEEVIGITKFCVHPAEWFKTKQRIGGTKTINAALVRSLQPDLVIANKEENVKEQVEELQTFAPVYVTDISTLQDSLDAINAIGTLVGRHEKATQLSAQINTAFQALHPLQPTLSTAYFIWKDPYMVAGGDTFINDLLSRCGFDNIFKNVTRYPEVSLDYFCRNQHPLIQDALSLSPQQLSVNCMQSNLHSSSPCQLILLSSEPYPFKQKHVKELQLQLPDSKIIIVDGEMFSWYGSRLLYAADYFKNLVMEIDTWIANKENAQ